MPKEAEKEAEKVAAKEVPDQDLQTLGKTPEQTPSEESAENLPGEGSSPSEEEASASPIPGVPDEEIVEILTPPPPTPQEILAAIQLLTSLQADAEGEVSEGDEGDIFLCYDISLRIRGEKTFRIRSSRCLHGILLPEGLPSATSEMESALFTITQPVKQKLMGIVARLTTQTRGGIPRPLLEMK